VNAGLALALLRHQHAIHVPAEAALRGLAEAEWPARMQRLERGPLTGDREVWLDGGHNPSAAEALAAAFAGRQLDVIVGMLANKDAESFLRLLRPIARSLTAVPIEGHEHHAPAALAVHAEHLGLQGRSASTVANALRQLTGPVLITGSLYLAGEVLAANGQAPQ